MKIMAMSSKPCVNFTYYTFNKAEHVQTSKPRANASIFKVF